MQIIGLKNNLIAIYSLLQFMIKLKEQKKKLKRLEKKEVAVQLVQLKIHRSATDDKFGEDVFYAVK